MAGTSIVTTSFVEVDGKVTGFEIGINAGAGSDELTAAAVRSEIDPTVEALTSDLKAAGFECKQTEVAVMSMVQCSNGVDLTVMEFGGKLASLSVRPSFDPSDEPAELGAVSDALAASIEGPGAALAAEIASPPAEGTGEVRTAGDLLIALDATESEGLQVEVVL